MARNDHLTRFKVRNFKGFTDLDVQDIGWVNVIAGDNNTGKTSLLEALNIYSDASGYAPFGRRLASIQTSIRGLADTKVPYLDFFVNRDQENWIDGTTLTFSMYYRNGGEGTLELRYQNRKISETTYIDGKKVTPPSKISLDNPLSNEPLPYIPVNLGYGTDLVDKYSIHIQGSAMLREQLLQDLKPLIPRISQFEIYKINTAGTIAIYQQGMDSAIPLPFFGEGAIKLFRILVELIVWRGQRLMIDEIDTGFHHSRMPMFWTTILQAARRHEVQLFVTTHNLECIQHLIGALEQEELADFQQDVRLIRLARIQGGKTGAFTYTFEQFAHAVAHEHEIR